MDLAHRRTDPSPGCDGSCEARSDPMVDTSSPQEHRRRLAAITVGDGLGYSASVEADESGSLDRLRRLFAELIEPRVEAFASRLCKTTSDGLLAVFRSALAAVEHVRHRGGVVCR